MTTIVNNPAPVVAPASENTGGSSLLIGAIVLIGFVMLLYFGIPAIRRMGPVQVNVPAPQVVVPGKIDLNVTQTK